MHLLAIETATEACSAALWSDGQVIERYQLAPREHNRLVLPMVEAVLAEAGLSANQLDALAFGRGPGSFTGVRIAAGVAQGIALGADLPVVPVSTLAALADAALAETGLDCAYACIDARMGEVYWAIYRRAGEGGLELLGDEVVLPAEQVTFPEQSSGVGTGSGWDTYGAALTERLGQRVKLALPQRFPRAGSVARLGVMAFQQGTALLPEQALPVYLRDNVAKKPARMPSMTLSTG